MVFIFYFSRHHDVAPVPEVVEDMKVCSRFLFPPLGFVGWLIEHFCLYHSFVVSVFFSSCPPFCYVSLNVLVGTRNH